MKINTLNTGIYTTSARKTAKNEMPQNDKFIKSEGDSLNIYNPIKVRGRHDGEFMESISRSDLGLAIFASTAMLPTPMHEALKTVSVIYTNDIHGAITPSKDDTNPGGLKGGVAYVGSAIKELKDKAKGN